jgi:hypothetical protein
MKGNRVIAGVGLGVLVAAAIAVTPALGYPGRQGQAAPAPVTFGFEGGIGSFTPAAADPQLAAALARSGLNATGFRFTPSDSGSDGNRHNVSVAIQARSANSRSAGRDDPRLADADPSASVRLAPIAYNLGVAVGWKRFAISGDVAHLDLGEEPGSRQTTDVGVSYTGHRVSARVNLQDDRPLANSGPALIQQAPSQTIDVGGSYSLTRNLDVTAGVRYKSEQDRNRLPELTDNRRDSQAVYIGTAFRF